MKIHVVPGLILAFFGALTIALGNVMGLELDQVALLGVALGAVIGLVPDRTNTQKVVGFLVGFLVAWVGYAARAAILPDSVTGRTIAIFVVLLVASLIAFASSGRLPAWSMLVGMAALAGAYEATYIAAPAQFMAESPIAVTSVLLAVAMGNIATLVLTNVERKDHESKQDPRHAAEANA